MPAPRNTIKSALLRGEMQIGTFLDLASLPAAEIAAQSGVDWCLIDAEHGPSDVPLVRDQLLALQAHGCPGIVRVPVGEAWVLKQMLDIGAQTLLVPMVDSGEQAAAVARAVRYPPAGNRGLAAGVVRASGYGAQADYMHTANDQILLMVQAESRAAVANIDDIAGAEGVDCVFVGPSDLAADMGYLGQTAAPEVEAAIEHIIARTRAAGKIAAIFCLNPDLMVSYRDQGAQVIAVASDVVALNSGLRAACDRARAALAP